MADAVPNPICPITVMAENEYLDSSKARRWQAVAEALRDRRPVADVADVVLERFRRTMRNIAKDLPLADWLASMSNPTELATLLEASDGGFDVKDLLLQAAINEEGPKAIEAFLNDALENCLYDIPYIAARLGDGVNLTEARHTLNDVRRRVVPELQRMAEKFHDNPTWLPRRSSNGTDTVKKDQTKEMLGESLISGFRR